MKTHLKKIYLLAALITALFILLLFLFLPTIKCGGFKEIPFERYTEIINNEINLKNQDNIEENIKYINKEAKSVAIKRLKLPHRCLPLFSVPLFVVYGTNTYLSENNTYVYQYNYDVIAYPLITDIGAWMAGDGLIEDKFFITYIRYKNGYLEFKEVGNRLMLVGIGKMYGI
jgi:hypothetical protein